MGNINDAVLGVDGESSVFEIGGKFDIVVHGLTQGSIKLQYKFTDSETVPDKDFWDFPEGEFVEDVFKELSISSKVIVARFIGVGNNAGVYVRASRYL